MKKTLKIIGIILLGCVILTIGFGIYQYQTNDMIRAIVNNDESKLYYFPSKKMIDLQDLDYEEIELEVEDGIKIYNYYFKSKSDTMNANMFFIHSAGGNATYCKDFVKPLLNSGFDVYVVDWRGYGKSNGTPNYKNVIKDTQKSFEDYKRRVRDAQLKTIVYGQSLGGQVAVKIVLDNTTDVDAFVLDGSIPSAQQMAIDYAPVAFLKQKAKEHPEGFNQDYVASRDIAKINDIPKLIIHSKRDQEVLFAHGKTLYNNAQEPKMFWETDTKHIMTLLQYPNETIDKIKVLLQ